MAMLAQKTQPPGSLPDRPALAEGVKQANLSLVESSEEGELPEAVLKRRIIDFLEKDLGYMPTIPLQVAPPWEGHSQFVGPKPLQEAKASASVEGFKSDDKDRLEAWFLFVEPIPKNVVMLHDKERHIKQRLKSLSNRQRNGTKPSVPNKEYVPTWTTRGWWGLRPPTVQQLLQHASRIKKYEREQTDLRAVKYRARREGIKSYCRHNIGVSYKAKKVSNADEMFLSTDCSELARKQNEDRAWDHRLEFQRYMSWGLKKSEHFDKYQYMTGLQKFFEDTGVPKNDTERHAKYWNAIQNAYYAYSCTNTDEKKYQLWLLENAYDESEQLEEWHLKRKSLNGHMLPELPTYGNVSHFQQKVNAYRLGLDRIFAYSPTDGKKALKLRQSLFPDTIKKKKQSLSLETHTYHPLVAVGEPTDDHLEREDKLEKIRESLKQSNQAKPNTGKEWPYLGFASNVSKEDDEDDDYIDELSRRVMGRSIALYEVKAIVREEVSKLQDEMFAYMSSEFSVAMEDAVGQAVKAVTESAVKRINEASVHAQEPSVNDLGNVPSGYHRRNPQGLILPDVWKVAEQT